MVATRQNYETFCNMITETRELVMQSLKDLVKDMGIEVNIPCCIDDYVYNAIAYNGGNHPEYASDCFARFEKVYYDKSEDSIFIVFEDGYEQELSENSIDDILVVMDVLLVIRDNNLKDE